MGVTQPICNKMCTHLSRSITIISIDSGTLVLFIAFNDSLRVRYPISWSEIDFLVLKFLFSPSKCINCAFLKVSCTALLNSSSVNGANGSGSLYASASTTHVWGSNSPPKLIISLNSSLSTNLRS